MEKAEHGGAGAFGGDFDIRHMKQACGGAGYDHLCDIEGDPEDMVLADILALLHRHRDHLVYFRALNIARRVHMMDGGQ